MSKSTAQIIVNIEDKDKMLLQIEAGPDAPNHGEPYGHVWLDKEGVLWLKEQVDKWLWNNK